MMPLTGQSQECTIRVLKNMRQFGGDDLFKEALAKCDIAPYYDLQKWIETPRASLDFVSLLRVGCVLRRLVSSADLFDGSGDVRSLLLQFCHFIITTGTKMVPPHMVTPELSRKSEIMRQDFVQFFQDISKVLGDMKEFLAASDYAVYSLQLLSVFQKQEIRNKAIKQSYSRLRIVDFMHAVIDCTIVDANKSGTVPLLMECIRLLNEEDSLRSCHRALQKGLVQNDSFVNFVVGRFPPDDLPDTEGAAFHCFTAIHQEINEWTDQKMGIPPKKRSLEAEEVRPNKRQSTHVEDLDAEAVPPPPPLTSPATLPHTSSSVGERRHENQKWRPSSQEQDSREWRPPPPSPDTRDRRSRPPPPPGPPPSDVTRARSPKGSKPHEAKDSRGDRETSIDRGGGHVDRESKVSREDRAPNKEPKKGNNPSNRKRQEDAEPKNDPAVNISKETKPKKAMLAQYKELVHHPTVPRDRVADLRVKMEKALTSKQQEQYRKMKNDYLTLKAKSPSLGDKEKKTWRLRLEKFVCDAMAKG